MLFRSDCLSRYYENDTFDELHEPEHYVSADSRLDPELEDLPALRVAELTSRRPMVLARRAQDREEERLLEAERMHLAESRARQDDTIPAEDDGEDIALGEALDSPPSLRTVSFYDNDFTQAVKNGYQRDPLFEKILDNPGHHKTFRVESGIVYTKNRSAQEVVCIPRAHRDDSRSLTEIIITHAHEALGHLGSQKTSDYARRWFWWPRMGSDIEKYCTTCVPCQMSKSSNRATPGLLHSLPIPTRPWSSIGMDFVGPFPLDSGYDYLWVVLCRLTSLVHLIPISIKTTTAELAWIYLREVVRLHGMPDTIVSDRDAKFTARFWRELHRVTGTKLLMSTSWHPQTDGQSERAIRSVGQILRSVVRADQTDWMRKTPMTEFAINSSVNSSTGFAPFDITYGYLPRFSPFPTEKIAYRGVTEFAERARTSLEIAHDAIIESRVSSTYHANRRRSEEKPYEVNDLVYLSTKNLNLPKNRARKLAPKYIGPFRVTGAFPESSDYDLELSSELKARRIHPRFHASLLRPYEANDDSLFPKRETKRFYDFGMPDEDEWLVDEIFGHRLVGDRREFAVKWTATEPTWEVLETVQELAALDQYLALHGADSVDELFPSIKSHTRAAAPRTTRPRMGPAEVAGRKSARPRNRPVRLIEE